MLPLCKGRYCPSLRDFLGLLNATASALYKSKIPGMPRDIFTYQRMYVTYAAYIYHY